jgi:hypothetical protein
MTNPTKNPKFDSVDTDYTNTEELETRRRVTNRLDSNRFMPTSRGKSEPLPAKSATLEDESWWSYVADYTVDTSEFYRGTQSFRFDLSQGQGGALFASANNIGPVDMTGLMPSLALRREAPDPAYFTLSVALWDSSGNSQNFYSTILSGEYRPIDNWYRIECGAGNTGVDMTDIDRIDIAIRDIPSDATNNVWVDDLRFVPTRDRGAMIFTFDGTDESIYTDAYPILDKYGLSATVAIDEKLGQDGRLSESQIAELAQAGWEIGVHSNAAQLDDDVSGGAVRGISEAEMEKRLRAAKREIQALGYNDVNYLVTLQNGFDGTFLDVAPKHFGLAWGSGHTGSGRSFATPFSTNPWALNRTRSADTLPIDAAETYGTVHTSYWHSAGSGGEITASELDSLASYAANTDIDVITPARLLMERGDY